MLCRDSIRSGVLSSVKTRIAFIVLYGEDGSGAFGRGPVSYGSVSELREKIQRGMFRWGLFRRVESRCG